jgi:signal transduction histidine kinase
MSYKQRLFLYFAIIFVAFTISVIIFEQSRDKKFKTKALEEQLDAYTEMIYLHLRGNNFQVEKLDTLIKIFPQNIRVTLVDIQGVVQYDNYIKEITHLEMHNTRPEIIKASKVGKGTDIRISMSNNCDYLYYARKIGNRYIRVALPYEIHAKNLLKTDKMFLYFILALLAIMFFLMNIITGRFGKSIRQLRDFMNISDKKDIPNFDFPNDELGEIGAKIIENYRQLNESKKKIDLEREKLLQHVHISEEGICFFDADRNVEFFNGLFIQYLNTIADEPNSDLSVVFTDNAFDEMNSFIQSDSEKYFETHINRQGKTFSLRVNIFEDKGFEIVLNDITKHEKMRLLKQEMTGNIAHELRTPVTSIRGYLETVIEQQLDEDKKKHFITRAYQQTIVLSELIQDMSLITKIEEAPQSFKMEDVNISSLLQTLKNDLALALNEKNIDMQWDIPDNLTVTGNQNLLYAIFRNLTDNVIRYAGENINIQITKYNEDKDFYYFSFYDTGAGIPNESHLNRLFERFYRINEGRTRDTGGSGLGLSIVKNAVAFHKGSITVKNRKEGGLEFLFNLNRKCELSINP